MTLDLTKLPRGLAQAALLVATLTGAAPAPTSALTPGPVAGPSTPTRVGDHSVFGRIVFDLPPGATFDVVTEGERVLVVFKGAGAVAPLPSLPRNVLAVQTGVDTATIQLAPGASPRSTRLGSRLVIDISASRPKTGSVQAASSAPRAALPLGEHATDRAEAPAETPPATAASTGPVPAHTVAPSVAPNAAPPAARTKVAAGSETSPVVPVTKEPLSAAGTPPVGSPETPTTVASAPELAPPAKSTPAPPAAEALIVRADTDVGVAAFRRGDLGLVVFDRHIAVPPAPLGAAWISGPVSMTLQVPLSPGQQLTVTRRPADWSVQRSTAPVQGTMQPGTAANGVVFHMPRPGRVVSVLDPSTGGALLVGTSLAQGNEAAAPDTRRTPGYTLLATWLGVAIEPASDRVMLRNAEAGFALTGGDPLPPSPIVTATRRFDLPDQPPAMLFNRLQAQLAGAAAAAPRARTSERVAAAQTMLALGMGLEEHGLMQLVAAEDPQAANDAQVVALSAIGATLAGRLNEAQGLDDPRLDGTDEIALWRGLRDRRLDRPTPAASHLPDAAALAKSYPEMLRNQVWPDVAEAAAEAGRPLDDQAPPFAAAIALERAGKLPEALAAYDGIAAGRDRRDQVRATVRAAELRLAMGQVSPSDTAAVLERQSFAWRGDGREAALRIRAAELRGTAGEWKAALDALRTIDAQFPEQHALVQRRKAQVLEAMLAAEGQGLSPLDLVLLAADYAGDVPGDMQGGALARLLADKLLALDLPARAIPVLQGLMRTAPAGEPRAEFGLRLSQLLLDGGEPSGAATALAASASPDLSAPLREKRALLQARVKAAQGDLPGAAAGLFELGTATADDLRASLLATGADWRGSLSALSDLAAKIVPPQGVLNDAAQDVLLREATAAARIPDPAMLRALEASAARMSGPKADLFHVLTALPVGASADLPRAAQDLRFARAIPAQISAIGSR